MQLLRTKRFAKQFRKLPKPVQEKFEQRLHLFVTDPDHPLLRIHSLTGDRLGLFSLNVTADYRALFTWEGERVTFYEIGSHSELYS